MTPELMDKLRDGSPPFSGSTLIWQFEGGLDDMCDLLRSILKVLSSDSAEAIYLNEDWHEHDGYLCPAGRADWPTCEQWCSSASDLIASCSDEWAVGHALFPVSSRWLLRVNIDEDGPSNYSGDVTMSMSDEELQMKINNTLSAAGFAEPEILPSKEHFDRTYAG